MKSSPQQLRAILKRVAIKAMQNRGLRPDFSPEVMAELQKIRPGPAVPGEGIRDLRTLPWSSIDNPGSLDLDQLSVAIPLISGEVKVLVAIADVDSLVARDSVIDGHARYNTTTVYTPAVIFPMLPEKLSTDLTSLKYAQDRLAVAVEMRISADGSLVGSDVYRAVVHNQAKLDYPTVAAWLEASQGVPEAISAVPGLAENLHLQDQVAQRIQKFRFAHGALCFETREAHPVFNDEGKLVFEEDVKNRASDMIENFMIFANSINARFLTSHQFPSIRRVVLAPKRWDRIVEIAAEYNDKLPAAPDSSALEAFLQKQKAENPAAFPDLSLAVIKLIGSSEYVAELPGDPIPDHFSLAVRDYTHSTAPNRRYADLITQRLLKAALQGQPCPYRFDDLLDLAKHCDEQEEAAEKTQRQVNKSAAALILQPRIGEQFDAIVTGASEKGTWVRLLSIPVEGKLTEGVEGQDVGDRLRVRLVSIDVNQGYIDFHRST